MDNKDLLDNLIDKLPLLLCIMGAIFLAAIGTSYWDWGWFLFTAIWLSGAV